MNHLPSPADLGGCDALERPDAFWGHSSHPIVVMFNNNDHNNLIYRTNNINNIIIATLSNCVGRQFRVCFLSFLLY